jgi:multicomponent Na+:H+ antiporter subunit B
MIMESLINMALLTLLAVVTIGILRVRSLFAVVVLAGAYSFLMASVMLVLDAVDVAMTEAAVGAGVSMVLALSALYLTKTEEAPPRFSSLVPLFVAVGTGIMLVYGTYDLPPFGAADTPMNTHVGLDYLQRNYEETHIPNVVTSVLASYRGFDTLGETTVIFTAGIGVLLLLKRFRQEG